jgi:hypothetical protein
MVLQNKGSGLFEAAVINFYIFFDYNIYTHPNY